MGKSDPERNSTMTTVTKKCDPQPSSGAQKGTDETIKIRQKQISNPITTEIKKAKNCKRLV